MRNRWNIPQNNKESIEQANGQYRIEWMRTKRFPPKSETERDIYSPPLLNKVPKP